jgi:hypothetical protein
MALSTPFEGRGDGKTGGREDGGMGRREDGRTGGWEDGKTGGRGDGKTGGRGDGGTGGWGDGRMEPLALHRSIVRNPQSAMGAGEVADDLLHIGSG